MSPNQKMWACIWAGQVAKDAQPVFTLNKGDRFVWPHARDDEPFVYIGRGWYQAGDRKCRTGIKTAVIKIADEKKLD